MRLYANENFPLPTVRALRLLGHDVVTARDAGNAGRAVPDPEVLAFAAREGRALITLNRRDFVRLSPSRAHAGIIVCTQDPDPAGQAQRIDDAIRLTLSLENQIVRVNRPARP